VILLALGLRALPAPPPPKPLAEHQIKALYLFNFAKYVEWPKFAFPATNAPFIIGIKGNPDIVRDLSEITRGKLLKNRLIHIVSIETMQDHKGCQMIFIEGTDFPGIIHSLTGPSPKPVLTVGACDTFLNGGGIINFLKKDNTLRMEINLKNAHLSGLAVSSKLLAVATVKNNESNQPPP